MESAVWSPLSSLYEPLHAVDALVIVEGDIFEGMLSDHGIAAAFGVMAVAQRHLFTIVTRYPLRAAAWFKWANQNAHPLSVIAHAARDYCNDEQDELALNEAPLPNEWPLPNVGIYVRETSADVVRMRPFSEVAT